MHGRRRARGEKGSEDLSAMRRDVEKRERGRREKMV
jgi:hypothetical protein